MPYPADAELSGDIRHVHDPAIIKHGSDYYLFSTNDGIPIRRSRDLHHWERIGRVFEQQLPSWAPAAVPGVVAPWAPDLAFFNGRYHLYYSLSTFGSQRSVIGLATATTLDPRSPDYGWEDQGRVVESWPGVNDHNAIDPNVAFDEQGEPWLSWGSFWGGIRMRKLDPQTGQLSQSHTTQYALAARPVGNAVEAPFIVRRGGYFYLFVSFDSCCQGVASTYNIRVGRAPVITGPYLDRGGVPMMQGGGTPVLTGYGRYRGPGHNAVVSDEGGDWLVHHYYDAHEAGVPKVQLRPLLWEEEEWPLAADPSHRVSSPASGGTPDLIGDWGYWVDSGLPTRVRLHADGRFATCDAGGSWTFHAPWLTLRWQSGASPAVGRTEKGIVAADGRHYVGRTQDDRLARAYRLDDR